jgi:hypothetical protein
MQRLSDRRSDSAFVSVPPQQNRVCAADLAGLMIHLASKKAGLPTDLAGPAFSQNLSQMLGLAAFLLRTSCPTNGRRDESVIFSIWTLALIYMRSIFFDEKDLYSHYCKRRSVGAERTPSWAQK